MALILDTNALSAFVDGDPSLHRQIERETDLALQAVVLGEYMFGIRQSRHRKRYEEWLRIHLRVFFVLGVGIATAERYAEIRSELRSAGQPIPSNDLWIASIAREHGFAVVARDEHFDCIRGLRVMKW